MRTLKTFVIKETVKNAKEYFKNDTVLYGLFNGKPATYISSGYYEEEKNGAVISVYSAKPGNRYLGLFVALKEIKGSESKGIILIAK